MFLLACLLLVALGMQAGCSDEGDFTSEGTLADPKDLGTAPTDPHEGSVSGGANSYYFAIVTIGTNYTVSMSQLVDDADLAIFEDPGFSTSTCGSINNGTASETCPITPNVSIIYILVKPSSTTGTSYLISVQ